MRAPGRSPWVIADRTEDFLCRAGAFGGACAQGMPRRHRRPGPVSRALVAAHWPLPKLTGIRAGGHTAPLGGGGHQRSHQADPPLRPWALLDARREQIDYLNDARRADIRPAGWSH